MYHPPDRDLEQFIITMEKIYYNLKDKSNYEITFLGNVNVNMSKLLDTRIRIRIQNSFTPNIK